MNTDATAAIPDHTGRARTLASAAATLLAHAWRANTAEARLAWLADAESNLTGALEELRSARKLLEA